MSRASVLLLGTVIVATGCAGKLGERRAEEVQQYCAERYADKRIDPIRSKIVIPISATDPQPIEILANRQRANAAERDAILALSEARNECNKFAFRKLGAPPAYRSATQDRVTAELADLYAGDITYGEFAKALLFIGERDKLAAEDAEQSVRQRERWKDLEYSN